MKSQYTLIACSMLLALYVFWAYDPLVFFRDPKSLAYLTYAQAFQNIAFIVILVFFVGMIGSLPRASQSGKNSTSAYQYWLLSFWGFMLPLIGLNVLVNPHGVFPWQYISTVNTAAYIPTAARSQKLELYLDLELPPEVVIMGSSRAFTLPSAYIKESTGYRTFNMAVNGGGPFDFHPFGKFIVSRQKNRPPLVFVVELVAPDFDVAEVTLPVSLIPYLSSNRRSNTVLDTLHDVVSLQSISDTFFQLTYARFYPKQPAMTFEPDGTGVRVDITKKSYERRVASLTLRNDERYRCDTLSDQGLEQLGMLVQLAAENKTAILFYRSPLNADYLEAGDLDHPFYQKCETLFLEAMDKTMEENSNVFFRDLTYYEPISSLRWDGYYDVHHLKPKAARMLIDALAPDIKLAAAWSLREGR